MAASGKLSSAWRGGGSVSLAAQTDASGFVSRAISRFAAETRRGRLVVVGNTDGSLSLLDLRAAAPATSNEEPTGRGPRCLVKLNRSSDEKGGHSGSTQATAWLPADDRLFVSGGDTRLKLWDASAPNQCVMQINLRKPVRAAAVTDGSAPLLAAALGDSTVRLVDLRMGSAVGTMQGHTRPPICLAWGAPGQLRLFSGGMDGTVRAWDARMGARSAYVFDAHGDEDQLPLKRMEGSSSQPNSAKRQRTSEHPESSQARKSNPYNSRIEPYRFVSLSSFLGTHQPRQGGRRDQTFGTGSGTSTAAQYTSPSQVAKDAANSDSLRDKWKEDATKKARLFLDPPRREYEHEPAYAHRDAVIALVHPVVRNGAQSYSRLLSCGVDGRIRVWDAATGLPAAAKDGKGPPKSFPVNCWTEERSLQLDAEGPPEDVCMVPEQNQLVAYCLRTGQLICRLAAHDGQVTAVQCLSSRREVLTSGEDGRLLTWRLSVPFATASEEVVCLD